MKYNPDSDELSVQLTNTTQTKLERTDLQDLTELVDESYPWYGDIYSKTMESFSHVCEHLKGVKAKSLSNKGYHLIGLDFLPSEDGIVYLLEINKHPAIYYDEERMVRLHHRMESRLFTDSFFDTVLLAGKTTQTPDNFNKINI